MRQIGGVAAGVLALTVVWRLLLAPPMTPLPPVMLWAWERPVDLTFLDCRLAGVAVLAATITLDTTVHVEPRRQPVAIPDGCPSVAVVRIEAGEGPVASEFLTPLRHELLRISRRPGIRALQIDFDAGVSQRRFYRTLLERLRRDMPNDLELTITALASWCLGDDWISDLPIDEAVPMLFRLGVDTTRVRGSLRAGTDFQSVRCRGSLGVSTDEWPVSVPRGRRVYVFHPRPWTPSDVADTLNRVATLQ